MRENSFQSKLIKKLKAMFPGCVVLKNDASYISGFPDLTILYGSRWAVLECKRSARDIHQPNQDYYVDKLHAMSYSAFVYPENEEVVLRELEQTFLS